MEKGCHVFLAASYKEGTKVKSKEKRWEDVLIVKNSRRLPGLHTARQDFMTKDLYGQALHHGDLWYVVPTGRVVVPTGRYIVPAGKVIIIVSTGRLSLVPTGRVLSPGRVK
ncbi:hypothetical protein Tco_0978410 [Tanacetum coccineum]|uniref:Uncharacterized protein n=1 Tax=Tanacetum coccineum TaxID=301880 RepID=A0ABQ5ENB4_9ASTR